MNHIHDLPAFAYSIDGHCLTFTVAGRATVAERMAVLDALRADPRVPDGAFLLLDIRGFHGLLSREVAQQRLEALAVELGHKMGPVCAILTRSVLATQSRVFEMTLRDVIGVKVRMFDDEAEARAWR